MARPRSSPQPEGPGLTARRIAADIVDGVLRRKITLDEQLSGKTAHPGLPALTDRDRALMRRLPATVLRRLCTLRHLLGAFLEKGFPADAPRIETILLIGAAQILWLEGPDHAAVDLAGWVPPGGPPRPPLRRAGQCCAAACGAEPHRYPGRKDLARHAGLATQALEQDLRYRCGAGDCRSQRPRAGTRPHRQA